MMRHALCGIAVLASALGAPRVIAQTYEDYRETWRNLHPARFVTYHYERVDKDIERAGYVSDRPLEWSRNLGADGSNELVDPFEFSLDGPARARHVLIMVHGYGPGGLMGGGYADRADEFSTDFITHNTGTSAWYQGDDGPALYSYLRSSPPTDGFDPAEWVILGVTIDITQGTGLPILENQRRLRALMDLLWYHKKEMIRTISFVSHSTGGPVVKGVLGSDPAEHPWINYVDDHINLAGALGGTPFVYLDIPGGFGAPDLRHQLMYGVQHPDDFTDIYAYYAGRTAEEGVFKRTHRWPGHINVLSVAGVWGGAFDGNPWSGTQTGVIPWNISNPVDLRLVNIHEGKTDGVVPSMSVIEHIRYKQINLSPIGPDPFQWHYQIPAGQRYGVDYSSNWTLPSLGSPGSLFVTGGAGHIPLGAGSNADNIPAADRFRGEKVTYVEINAQHNGMLQNEHLLRAIRRRLGTFTVKPNVELPRITALMPDGGPVEGGNTIRIHGTGFKYVTQITFGEVPVSEALQPDSPPPWTVLSENEIAVPVPEATPIVVDPHAYFVKVSVTNTAGESIGNSPFDQYQYRFRVQTPVISPEGGTFDAPPLVTITSGTANATIYYTLNGSEPGPGNPFAHVYTAPIIIPAPLTGDLTPFTLRARAVRTGFDESGVASAVFTVEARVATPTIFPNGGHFTGFANVTLSTATPGATIYYTTDGSEPTYLSTPYTGQFQLGVGDHEVKARAYRITYNESDVGSATFLVYDFSTERAADPVVFPRGSGNFTDSVQVQMTSYTEGAQIRYTIGKNEPAPPPTEASTLYTQPFVLKFDQADVNDGGTNWFIHAQAFRAGLPPSNITPRTYNIAPGLALTAAPTFNPSGGTFQNDVTVSVASATQFARIYHTTDGRVAVYDPDLPSLTTPANLTLRRNTTLRAVAKRPFFSTSAESTAEFVFQAAVPEITGEATTALVPADEEGAAEVFVDSVRIVMSTATNNGIIRYTLDGSEPTEESTRYTEPIYLAESATVTARAFKSGYFHSDAASRSFSVSAAEPPSVTHHPQNIFADAGAEAVFAVRASGLPPPQFQWQFEGKDIEGQTSDTLRIEAAQPADAGSYRVIATNPAGADTSDAAVLAVDAAEVPPEIVTQPESRRVAAGATSTLAVVATGKPAPAYQWFKDGRSIRDATSAEFVIEQVTSEDAGVYRVAVTNVAGSDTSRGATLTVTRSAPAEITRHPQSISVMPGDTARFSVEAAGEPPPSYQWLHDGYVVPGAVQSMLELPNARLQDAGSYVVIVFNLSGADTSRPAVLTITPTSADYAGDLPHEFALYGNYPNPFNPTTTIRYALAADSDVRLDVFDLLGRRVAVLVDERQATGRHAVAFEAGHLPSGVYWYRLKAGDFVSSKRLVVVK